MLGCIIQHSGSHESALKVCCKPSKYRRKDEKTILYLAYGSNLSSETFLGNRGIKPISSTNVQVPSLDLTFSLPGLPYIEPCFANTAYRSPSKSSSYQTTDDDQQRWDKGLIGVVYEVTPEDYRKIIATEGGGAGYQDILVDCYIMPKDSSSITSTPIAKPFKAHTLLSPSSALTRPNPSYAQPSARYLKLITDGAEEHSLPAEYIAYLYSLQAYTITSYRQTAGKVVFAGLWMPAILAIFALGMIFSDGNGNIPKWLARVYVVLFAAMWRSYDVFFKSAFGDGERTIERGQDAGLLKNETSPSWEEKSSISA
ncbi:hypothetical protein B0O99DRAFT_647743 [Bisporella sp. PMI_857]|nr:hypothetical protein B0O99DRAFT_647743 [Bisporella sp. PMI_857]